MKTLISAIIIALVAFPVQAGVYTTKTRCKPLNHHAPRADVEAKTGYDHHGNALAPVDANAPPMDVEALKNPPIALNLPINEYIKADRYNVPMDRAEIQLGTIQNDQDKGVTLNGSALSAQEYYPEECEQ